MKHKKIVMAILLPLVLCCMITALTLLSGAASTVERKGAMIEIEESLGEYRLGEVKRIDKDGYIGIPVQLSVYHKGDAPVTSGVGGTPVILYVVNANIERIGTKSDT